MTHPDNNRRPSVSASVDVREIDETAWLIERVGSNLALGMSCNKLSWRDFSNAIRFLRESDAEQMISALPEFIGLKYAKATEHAWPALKSQLATAGPREAENARCRALIDAKAVERRGDQTYYRTNNTWHDSEARMAEAMRAYNAEIAGYETASTIIQLDQLAALSAPTAAANAVTCSKCHCAFDAQGYCACCGPDMLRLYLTSQDPASVTAAGDNEKAAARESPKGEGLGTPDRSPAQQPSSAGYVRQTKCAGIAMLLKLRERCSDTDAGYVTQLLPERVHSSLLGLVLEQVLADLRAAEKENGRLRAELAELRGEMSTATAWCDAETHMVYQLHGTREAVNSFTRINQAEHQEIGRLRTALARATEERDALEKAVTEAPLVVTCNECAEELVDRMAANGPCPYCERDTVRADLASAVEVATWAMRFQEGKPASKETGNYIKHYATLARLSHPAPLAGEEQGGLTFTREQAADLGISSVVAAPPHPLFAIAIEAAREAVQPAPPPASAEGKTARLDLDPVSACQARMVEHPCGDYAYGHDLDNAEEQLATLRAENERLRGLGDLAARGAEQSVAIDDMQKHIDELKANCRCPACGCATPEDAEAGECGCDAPVCAIEVPETLATAYVRVVSERDALQSRLTAAESEAEKLKDMWESVDRLLANLGVREDVGVRANLRAALGAKEG